jgi:hypothetical protein
MGILCPVILPATCVVPPRNTKFAQRGAVGSELVATKRRDRRAALKFLKRTMKRYGRPRSIVTDRLRSYRSAMKVIGKALSQ